MTNTYCLTAYGNTGWRDIRVENAPSMREAIRLAEKATGCLVSHGRGGVEADFLPGVLIDAATGEVTHLVDPDTGQPRKARPQVVMGPPDVLRDIAQAMKGQQPPKAPPKRKTGPGRKREAQPG